MRLRDVGRVEMGATNYNLSCTFNMQPSVGLAIFQLPGANALDTADRIRQKMDELKAHFPEGVDYSIGHDITPFIRESVNDVVRTLFEAIALVAIVVLVFLQNWRAALIPLVAVPVAIIGTFAVMLPFGFSLNNISLFGLVLAIGIVVDDAIVVVENVERWLEHGLAPREAARKAMDEVTSPVIAVALVLCAVFVPCAFISGITGQFFRQFAITIATSTVISAVNSLTLSPALAAILLKPPHARRDPLGQLLNLTLGWFFRLFNKVFSISTDLYTRAIGGLLRVSLLVLLVYGGLLALTYWQMMRTPLGFIPQQDQGYLLVNVQLPDSASLRRTQDVMDRVERLAHTVPGIKHTVCVSGLSFLLSANSSNFGSIFVILAPFDERRERSLGADAIMGRLRRECAQKVPEAIVTTFGAPPVPGIGVAGGFKIMVEDRASQGVDNLQQQTNSFIQRLTKLPGVSGALTMARSRTPQLFMDIDRTKVMSMGISLADVNQTLQSYLGSTYVNNFNAFGRYWQVNVMADGQFRDRVEEARELKVRNNQGKMAPLGALAEIREITGPVLVIRYNLYSAVPVNGNLYAQASTGAAIDEIDALSRQTLPRTMATEWTELMFMQIRAGNTGLYVFGLAVVFVFLALAALYESWSLPLAVILVVPMCLLSSVTGVAMARIGINIFVQIGFVVLVGLACKNAILIVEFANHLRHEGEPLAEATREASGLRLRPIMMTSFAFILGVVPLVLAEGAGAEMRQSLGIAVFYGMLGVTAFGIFLTPVFFYVIEGLSETRLFSSVAVRWYGSLLAGAAGGLGLGVLLWKAGIASRDLSLSVGTILGILTAFVVLRLKLRPKSPEPQQMTSSPSAYFPFPIPHSPFVRLRMISHFFIDRPIFATVLSIIVVLSGAVAVATLPVAQYPDVAPPTVLVTAVYPGANADTVLDTVAAPIEQQVSGVENMLYMSSLCTNDGAYTLLVTFKLGMDSDMAQVLVQNRASLALPVIPDLVQREGITVKKMSPSTLMIVNLVSEVDPGRSTSQRTTFSSATMPRSRSKTNWAGSPAWPTWPISGSAITACGPGSIRTRWPRSA